MKKYIIAQSMFKKLQKITKILKKSQKSNL